MKKLQVAEIFPSIHGEVNGHHQGRMVTFIRLSGCNLSCFYCDTAHTQDKNYGNIMSVEQIIDFVRYHDNKYVCITGGRPLLQDIKTLLKLLHEEGFIVSIETNGTIDITPFFRYVDSFIIDYKCGSTGYNTQMLISNYFCLREKDVIKFAVSYEDDIQDCKSLIDILKNNKAIIAFSPVENYMNPKELYTLIKKYEIYDVVLSVQIHKLIGLS